MDLKFPKNTEKQMISTTMRYFEENFNEELTDLKAKLLLDFFVKEIEPSIYNGAIKDAQAVMMEHVNDLEGTCFQKEFGYWEK